MKYIVIILSVFVFSSCLKENHSVRLKNYLSRTMYNVKAGTAQIGDVESGATSNYVNVSTGDFFITTEPSPGNTTAIGSVKISGKGKHKWTIYISVSGALSIAEDK